MKKRRKKIEFGKGIERCYSVAQVAKMFNVDKRTVMKWLDEYDGQSVIPASGWFRLPRSGYIRIKESSIKALQDE